MDDVEEEEKDDEMSFMCDKEVCKEDARVANVFERLYARRCLTAALTEVLLQFVRQVGEF